MEKRVPNSTAAAPNLQQSSPGASSSQKKQAIAQSEGQAVRSRNAGNGMKKTNSSNSQTNGSNNTFGENDTFNKHYNKELRVSKDEIPLVLSELNDSAVQFIKREQYDKALNLLQKAYGIMDVVDFNLCKRDQYHLFLLFHNMALCYQKMQMLEECSSCIEQALEHLPNEEFNAKEKSISNRMKKLQILCKLKMQYCAILSQVHRHKDALYQAKESVKLSHLLINDLKQLCEFYIKREEIESSILQTGFSRNMEDPSINYNSYSGPYTSGENPKKINSSRNKSFCHFLSQQEAVNEQNETSFNKGFVSQTSQIKKDVSAHNLSQFYNANYLEESMSYLEKTARKLMPILTEIKKKMIPEKKKQETKYGEVLTKGKFSKKPETLDSANELSDEDSFILEDKNGQKPNPDMKNILGYLNQGEWTQTLSIGSIMQLQPFALKELLEQGKNEMEMTRDSFIQKVSYLSVSYFCYSTEIRFILQMKEDLSWEPNQKQKESEYWHAKALEMACTFLPGECPLLNHINLSYQKHFAPVKQTILEDEINDDDLRVVKPLNGIENQKFQPIIRQVQNISIAITPYQLTPINQVTKQFLNSMIQFNDYQEQLFSSQSQQQQMSRQGYGHNISKSLGKPTNQSKLEIIDTQESDDVQKFEQLLDKLIKENKIDKNFLLQKLNIKQEGLILQGGGNAILDETEFNDALLDEQILQDEVSQDEEQIASEAHLQNSSNNNLYKFRNQDVILSERPKTTNQMYRNVGGHKQSESGPTQGQDVSISQRAIGSAKQRTGSQIDESEKLSQKQKLIEQSKKRAQRPLSGNVNKMVKNDSQRSRINKMNQNFSMFDKFGPNYSPEKAVQDMSLQNVDRSLIGQYSSQVHNTAVGKGHNKSFDANIPQQFLQNQHNQKAVLDRQTYQTHQKTSSQVTQPPNPNGQAYDELKRRLLNEYKKLCNTKKTFDEQVRDRYKNIKQNRGGSGKKLVGYSQNISSQPQIASNQQQPFQTNPQQQQPQTQLSPKHHLNVYKPTFIINNQFAGDLQQKDNEMVDQINKKYRQQSQGTQQQPQIVTSQQIQQQNMVTKDKSITDVQQRQDVVNPRSTLGSIHHERQSSQITQSNIGSQNQPLVGMILTQDKKTPVLSGSNTQKKTHQKQASQPNIQGDINFIKQFLQDKTNAGSKAQAQINAMHSGFMQPSQIQNQINHQSTAQSYIQGSKLLAHEQGKRHGTAGGNHSRKSSNNSSNLITNQHSQIMAGQGMNQSSSKLAAYEKLKKKLNTQINYIPN